MLASAALSGYGWRESSGNYSLQEAGVSVTTGTVATCTGAGITPVSGGKVLRVAPAFPAAAVAGSPFPQPWRGQLIGTVRGQRTCFNG